MQQLNVCLENLCNHVHVDAATECVFKVWSTCGTYSPHMVHIPYTVKTMRQLLLVVIGVAL